MWWVYYISHTSHHVFVQSQQVKQYTEASQGFESKPSQKQAVKSEWKSCVKSQYGNAKIIFKGFLFSWLVVVWPTTSDINHVFGIENTKQKDFTGETTAHE